jgi:DNA-binding LacI/PurR family transcriptional regulator
MGFDDIPYAAFMNPPLTTMRQDFPELGRRAIELLALTMEGERVGPLKALVPSLIARSSTASPATKPFS